MEKTISYSDIITTIVLVITVVTLFVSADRRIEKNTAEIKTVSAIVAENQRHQDQMRVGLESKVDRVLDKIDRMDDYLRSNR